MDYAAAVLASSQDVKTRRANTPAPASAGVYNREVPLSLHLALVVVIALAAWITGMDTHGSWTETSWLWAASAIGGAHLILRFLRRAR